MNIGGLQKTTLIDYPGKIAAIVFTAGCNMNCHYCHNPELRIFSPRISEAEIFDLLNNRKAKLEAVTITGGEPTVQADLFEFIKKIKKLGFLVKLDTNGTNPRVLKKLLKAKLVDYVALDIKAGWEKYEEVANCPVDKAALAESIAIIIAQAPDYEFRTTVVKDQLDEKDIEKIGELIEGAKRHYLQKFIATQNLNDPQFKSRSGLSAEEMEEMRLIMDKYVDEAFVR